MVFKLILVTLCCLICSFFRWRFSVLFSFWKKRVMKTLSKTFRVWNFWKCIFDINSKVKVTKNKATLVVESARNSADLVFKLDVLTRWGECSDHNSKNIMIYNFVDRWTYLMFISLLRMFVRVLFDEPNISSILTLLVNCQVIIIKGFITASSGRSRKLYCYR